MSPRNSRAALCMGIWLIFAVSSAQAQSNAIEAASENWFIRFYQTYLSDADGSRCPMHPTCSGYAAIALKKHGPVLGWIMTCDRLIRCGRSETMLAPRVRIHGQTRVFDPVEANDFWWFTRRPDPEGQ